MDKQYAVIGLGKFGYAVAQTLSQAGKQVLIVNMKKNKKFQKEQLQKYESVMMRQPASGYV